MKKMRMLTFVIMLLFCGVANAQHVGLQVGANFSKFTQNSSDKFALQHGLLIGPVVEFGLAETVFLKSGVLFTVKGDKRIYSGTIMPNLEYSVHYAQVPVNVVLKKDLKVATLFVQAGPYLGYAMSGNKWVADVKSALDFKDVDFGERLDFGIGAGVGIEISRFWAGVNFEAGFAEVYDYATSTGNNLTGSIYVGYHLF
jgi:hypothetical protein